MNEGHVWQSELTEFERSRKYDDSINKLAVTIAADNDDTVLSAKIYYALIRQSQGADAFAHLHLPQTRFCLQKYFCLLYIRDFLTMHTSNLYISLRVYTDFHIVIVIEV